MTQSVTHLNGTLFPLQILVGVDGCKGFSKETIVLKDRKSKEIVLFFIYVYTICGN